MQVNLPARNDKSSLLDRNKTLRSEQSCLWKIGDDDEDDNNNNKKYLPHMFTHMVTVMRE